MPRPAAAPAAFVWDAVAITTANPSIASALSEQLSLRRGAFTAAAHGLDEHTALLVVPDVCRKTGSGGATLNALWMCAEYLSAASGTASAVQPSALADARVLIIHAGGTYQQLIAGSVCTRAFSLLPLVHEDGRHSPVAAVDLWLAACQRLLAAAPPGVVVVSSEALILLPDDVSPDIAWSSADATVLATMQAPRDVRGRPLLYCPSSTNLRVIDLVVASADHEPRSGDVLRVGPNAETCFVSCDLIQLSSAAAQALVRAAMHDSTLGACTVAGADRGLVQAQSIDLFHDILACMLPPSSRNSPEHRAAVTPALSDALANMRLSCAWVAQLQHFCLRSVAELVHFFATYDAKRPKEIAGVSFCNPCRSVVEGAHSPPQAEARTPPQGHRLPSDLRVPSSPKPVSLMTMHLADLSSPGTPTNELVGGETLSSTTIVVNSIVGPDGSLSTQCFVESCYLQGNFQIMPGAFCCGIERCVGVLVQSGIVLQEVRLDPSSEALRPTDSVSANASSWLEQRRSSGVVLRHPPASLMAARMISGAALVDDRRPSGGRHITMATSTSNVATPVGVVGAMDAPLSISGMQSWPLPPPQLEQDSVSEAYGAAGPSADNEWPRPSTVAIGEDAWCVVVYGNLDCFAESFELPTSTFCNVPWVQGGLLSATGVTEQDLWFDQPPGSPRTLWTAKLYPVFSNTVRGALCDQSIALWLQCPRLHPGQSILRRWRLAPRVSLQDVHAAADLSAEIRWRSRIGSLADLLIVEDIIANCRSDPLLPILRPLVQQRSWVPSLLASLDQLAAWAPVHVACRALSTIADVLALMAGPEGGLRNGKASHPSWASALAAVGRVDLWTSVPSALSDATGTDHGSDTASPTFGYMHGAGESSGSLSGMAASASAAATTQQASSSMNASQSYNWGLTATPGLAGAVAVLAAERDASLDTSPMLMRAARHYDRAAQILVRKAVEMSTAHIRAVRHSAMLVDPRLWVTGTAPARLDLAGGWSDCAPMTFEHGGAILNMAVTVDDQRPITVRARRLDSGPSGVRVLLHVPGEADDDEVVEWTELDDISHFEDDQSILLSAIKAVLVFLQLVDVRSSESLAQQLADRHIEALEIECHSTLPLECGLGIRSIVIGTVLAVVGRVAGFTMDHQSLIHAVLVIEQMLGLGNGWQDQVGGMMPGVKLVASNPSLPITVTPNVLSIADDSIREVNRRMLLVDIGGMPTEDSTPIYSVMLRKWYMRDLPMVRTITRLTQSTWRMRLAIKRADLGAIGDVLNQYHSLKQCLVDAELPEPVAAVHARLQEATLGVCLMGAGPRGHILVLTREPEQRDAIQALVDEVLEPFGGHESGTVRMLGADFLGMDLKVQ